MEEPRPDEHPQRRREYSGTAGTLGLAALVVAVVGAGIWYFEIRGHGGSAQSDPEFGIIELDPSDNPTAKAPAAKVGRVAPSFRLRDIDGSTTTLVDLRGQYVLLNFWASWCGPCRAETPDLQAFSERLGSKMIIVGVNQQESRAAASEFVAQFDVTYPIVLDSDGEVSNAYRVTTGLPISFVIDAEGVIQKVLIGRVSEEDLNEIAAEFLS